jgi:hypothetical protein
MCAKFIIVLASLFVLTTSCRKAPTTIDQNGKFPTVSRDVKAVLDGGNELMSGEDPEDPARKFLEDILKKSDEQCREDIVDVYKKVVDVGNRVGVPINGEDFCKAACQKVPILERAICKISCKAFALDPHKYDPKDPNLFLDGACEKIRNKCEEMLNNL